MNINCAFISNDDNFTIFKYKNYTIRFKAPYSLEKYTDIVDGMTDIWLLWQNISIIKKARRSILILFQYLKIFI